MFNPSIDSILSTMKRKGYVVFENGDYNLNLIGVRKDNNISNKFDDTFIILYKYKECWKYFTLDCSTDPGIYYMQNGLTKGTAILKPGQYRGAYKLGLHQRKYDALVQYKPVTVYRDANKDLIMDYTNPETGMFGINIHRARENGKSIQVDKWSAGCTVIADSKDFDLLLSIVRKSLATGKYGTTFTYTLLEEKDFE